MRFGMLKVARGATATLMLALAACASGGATADTAPTTPAGGGASTSLPITVINEHGNAQHFTIFIEPTAGGVRTSLGEVEIGVTKTFTFSGPPGQYVFVAQTTGGNSSSPRFNHTGTNRVTWDRSTNRVLTSNR